MPNPPRDKPGTYRIRVQGVLDPSWADQLKGMTIVVSSYPDTPAVTTLTGVIANREDLESVLHTLYTLGLPLLSVERLTSRLKRSTH